MFDGETLSLDARAIVLSCSSIGLPRGGDVRPFGPRAWHRLAHRLTELGGQPGALVGMSLVDLRSLLGEDSADDVERLDGLLSRSGQLGFELERLATLGIWVRTTADADYPSRLRSRLGPDAPPVLFGAGEPPLLDRGGVAIVGSRDVDDAALDLTRRLAGAVARASEVVISGGARGVDQVSMTAAFESGGLVVGVLPEGVERRIRESTTRAAVAQGIAAIASPWHPAAGFSAGAAMARNKIVYALSDVAVVVSSSHGSGGTWAGAVEALDAGWVPVLVSQGVGVPEGNAALISRGGRSIDLASIEAAVSAVDLIAAGGPVERRVAEAPAPFEQQELALRD
jgi:predicted Rossmann fold nucleotide-binding protein DprA/Smf involved in DNA uptake